MTTPPVGSGQALPARVVELVDAYGEAAFHGWPTEIHRSALVAAIADAIEEARRQGVLSPPAEIRTMEFRHGEDDA